MKIFISWNGARSKRVAAILHGWLPLVLHYVEPWFSDQDIDAGDRWSNSISKELAECSFGIICLTPENLTAPWILFEAGALAKSFDLSKVVPLLLDLDFSDISGSGPLAQFQAKKLSKGGILDIISSIQKSSDISIPNPRLDQLFENLWPKLNDDLSSIPESEAKKEKSRPQPEILEELVATVRLLDGSIRDLNNRINHEYNIRRFIDRERVFSNEKENFESNALTESKISEIMIAIDDIMRIFGDYDPEILSIGSELKRDIITDSKKVGNTFHILESRLSRLPSPLIKNTNGSILLKKLNILLSENDKSIRS